LGISSPHESHRASPTGRYEALALRGCKRANFNFNITDENILRYDRENVK
jgi:hypothetical protein